MAGLSALSIDPQLYKGNFLMDLFWRTFYQQHLGEEYGGLATCNEGEIKIRTHRGLFRPSFTNDLDGMEGTEGIGYCGSVREPYFADSKLGKFGICFTGNATNSSRLIERLKNSGHTFERCDDVEIITKLIAHGDNVIDGLKNVNENITGAYSVLIITEDGIYAFVGSSGHWPLVIGEKEGCSAVSTESVGLKNMGFKLVRDIDPGEIIFLKGGGWISQEKLLASSPQSCSFLPVYTSFASATFKGIPVSLIRKRLGAELAKRDIEQGFIPDIVAPVPDSGRFHAIGYHQEFCRQLMAKKINRIPFYDELLLKYPYAGRSFTPPGQEARELVAQIKIVQSSENYYGKILVVCDDSIVRGTQTQTNLVPKLRGMGVKEIHFRISNPELLSYCRRGKTTQKGEILADRLVSIKEKIEFLKVESLIYNSIKELTEAIGFPLEQLCVECDLKMI